MSTDQEYAGDYGYDLAHEVLADLDSSVPRPRAAGDVEVNAAPFAGPFEADPHGDLGYDEAHVG